MQLQKSTILIAAGLVLTAAAACGQGRRGGRGVVDPSLGSGPLANSKAEQKIFDVAARVERRMNVPRDDGRVIRMLTEAIDAKTAVEVGTSTGYSGLWFALALRKTGGKLTTLELEESVAETARKNFREAGVDNLIEVIVGDAHETVKSVKGPIDIVFIDADKPGYKDYLEKLLPKVRPGGLILAHNISNRNNNPDYVDAVVENPALETLLFTRQLAVTLKKR